MFHKIEIITPKDFVRQKQDNNMFVEFKINYIENPVDDIGIFYTLADNPDDVYERNIPSNLMIFNEDTQLYENYEYLANRIKREDVGKLFRFMLYTIPNVRPLQYFRLGVNETFNKKYFSPMIRVNTSNVLEFMLKPSTFYTIRPAEILIIPEWKTFNIHRLDFEVLVANNYNSNPDRIAWENMTSRFLLQDGTFYRFYNDQRDLTQNWRVAIKFKIKKNETTDYTAGVEIKNFKIKINF